MLPTDVLDPAGLALAWFGSGRVCLSSVWVQIGFALARFGMRLHMYNSRSRIDHFERFLFGGGGGEWDQAGSTWLFFICCKRPRCQHTI